MIVKTDYKISNIIFMLENPNMIVDLYNTDCQINKTDKKETIEDVIQSIFPKFNLTRLLNFYNRYILTWSNKTKNNVDLYPIPINIIMEIIKLEHSKYDFDSLVKDTIDYRGYYENDISSYEISTNVDYGHIIIEVIDKYPEKIKQYKEGKLSIINMFFGEVIKKLPDKNIDKQVLREQIEKYLNKN